MYVFNLVLLNDFSSCIALIIKYLIRIYYLQLCAVIVVRKTNNNSCLFFYFSATVLRPSSSSCSSPSVIKNKESFPFFHKLLPDCCPLSLPTTTSTCPCGLRRSTPFVKIEQEVATQATDKSQ